VTIAAPKQHQLRFRPSFAGFAAARRELRTLLDHRPIDADSSHDIQLVFDEIAINIVRHGCARRDVLVQIAFAPDEAVLTFEDDGKPFDPRLHPEPPPPRSLHETPTGGRGVLLVRTLASRMDYELTAQRHNLLTLAVPVRSI